MRQQAKIIEIIFENMDYVQIPMEHIGAADFEDVDGSMIQLKTGELLRLSHARKIYLRVLSSFQFDYQKPDESISIYEEFDKRLLEGDISCFRVHYVDGTQEDISVPWEDCEGQYKNRLQKVEKDEEGNYLIRIGYYTHYTLEE